MTPAQINPCLPSPCGPNSICKEINETPSCSCMSNYIGNAPNCRPECAGNSECSSNLACINNKCADPCIGACGAQAQCRVTSHTPNCMCPPGFYGDPFVSCIMKQEVYLDERPTPCTPSPCGSNAVCREQNNAGACTCSPGYFGNPYEGCRPECVVNTDCPSNTVCQQNKCKDPCPGTCAVNAQCSTINHVPLCTCSPGYTGNPFHLCVLETCKYLILNEHYCDRYTK